MFQNQKKLRNFLYTFLILFTVFQACKPKYQEEIKPLETTPISVLSKKASVWWQNKQSQPKPQKRGGNVAPEIATTFYPDWSKGTTHRLSDNTIKLIVPVYRNTRVKYYYPTLRRAVFTLNPDSTITNGEIIEIITNTDDILTKYETHLFLNTDASNLLDFSGYVFQYDTQYTPTKLQGYANGVALKDPTTLDGAGGSATWDCDDKNGNPSDPSNGNPGNGNPSTGSWIVFIGSGSGSAINPPPPPPSSSLPSTGGGSTTGGGFIGPLPYVPPVNVTPGCGCGSSEGGGNSTPPPRLADIEASADMGGGPGLGASPPSGGSGGGSSFGGYGSSRRDAGDSRKVNSNPCGNSGGGQSYTSDNFPGKDEGFPFEWWKDEQWLKDNFKLSSDGLDLTIAEMTLIALYPAQAYVIYLNSDISQTFTTDLLLAGTVTGPARNGKADAFRHCFFNAMNARDIGTYLAWAFGVAHESETPQSLILEKQMDLYNNEQGHQISTIGYSSNAQLRDLTLGKITDGKLKYLSPLNSDGSLTSNSQLLFTNQ